MLSSICALDFGKAQSLNAEQLALRDVDMTLAGMIVFKGRMDMEYADDSAIGQAQGPLALLPSHNYVNIMIH